MRVGRVMKQILRSLLVSLFLLARVVLGGRSVGLAQRSSDSKAQSKAVGDGESGGRLNAVTLLRIVDGWAELLGAQRRQAVHTERLVAVEKKRLEE